MPVTSLPMVTQKLRRLFLRPKISRYFPAPGRHALVSKHMKTIYLSMNMHTCVANTSVQSNTRIRTTSGAQECCSHPLGPGSQ